MIEMQLDGRAALRGALTKMLRELDESEPKPTERLRVITKMAKNVNPGDLIDFPGYGWHEIGGWSQVDGVVSISAPGVPMLNFMANERVRIQRRVLS